MNLSEIESGMKFGHWEVLKFDHINKKNRVKYWLCKCDVCGTVRSVRGTALLNGSSTSCSKKCSNSLIGLTFGEWNVLKEDKSRPRYYICKCSCGNIQSVFGGSLKAGTTKSCGCLKKRKSTEKYHELSKKHTGEKYGLLTILEPIKKKDKYFYKCKCDCGNEIEVAGYNIFNGNTSSCGCLNSKANMEMDKILTDMKIPFKREYRFEECRDKRPLPFDFALLNEEEELIGLIELNGSQHYSCRGSGWNTPERLIYQQKHDYIKQLFCEINKIPLLIIPYQYFDDIKKFLITSDFWQIIIKNFND